MADIFGPLTPAERAAAASGNGPAKPKRVPIVPVPEDAPACAWRHPEHGKPVAMWPYYNAAGRLVGYAARVEYWGANGLREKDVVPITYCRVGDANGLERCAWRASGVPPPRALYCLPVLLADCRAPVIVTEGEKKADAVPALFAGFVGTTSMGGAKAAKLSDWTPLASRRVIIWPDNDEPGYRYAEDVARLITAAGAASVAIVTVPVDWPEGWDLADPLPNGVTSEALARLLEEAVRWTSPAQPQPSGAADDGAEIARLAALPPLAYEREREAAAERLGCRVSILDRLVAAKRGGNNASDTLGRGRPLSIADIEPWPEPVDGAELLDALVKAIRSYVVLDAPEADVAALWLLGVHAFDAWTIFPRLFVTAPEKQCGKTTLLDVLSRLVTRPLVASGISAAALFRTVEAARPTLLLDEADAYARDNEDLRGVINSGHRRDGIVIRTVGDNHEPCTFSTWAPMALAAIGHLPGTIEDRSIAVRLRRRRSDEPVESLRLNRTGVLDELARRAARWAADHVPGLAAADPVMPDGIYNRAADNWCPLLAVADEVCCEWSERARTAITSLAAGGAEDAESARVLLLADLRELFAGEPSGVLFTKEILAALAKDENRPWPEWKNGKPITDRQLAALLKPFEVRPKSVRRGAITEKGYRSECFEDAFARYLSGSSVTASQRRDSAPFGMVQSVTPREDVTEGDSSRLSISATCDAVTDDPTIVWWRDDADRWPEHDPEEASWME
jgi:putative DNA primase/helicase